MARSAQQRLDDLDSTIATIEAGGVSSYSINNRAATKLDLPALYAERRSLQFEVQRESGRGTTLAKIGRRR